MGDMNIGGAGLDWLVRRATVVDAVTAQSPDDTGATDAGLAAAVTRLLDVEAIRNLACLYNRGVDDRELDTLVRLFTPDGAFVRLGVRTEGWDQLRAMWAESARRYAYTHHATYGHVVVPDGATVAYGWAYGQAQLSLGAETLLAAYRYDDRYLKHEGRWLFRERILSFSYVLPADSLPAVLGEADRMRWPGRPASPGEYP